MKLKESDVTLQQYEVLETLYHGPTPKQAREIARDSRHSYNSTTTTLRRMREKGLVSTEKDPLEYGVSMHELTEYGRETFEQIDE